jgi:hypothetical protein
MRTRILLAALILGLASTGAFAFDRSGALGADGEVFMARVGTYRSLFPKGKAASPEHLVLALDVTRPGEALERLLVPGTEGDEIESAPFVVYEEASGSLFLVWQSQVSGIHPVLSLIGFRDETWGRVIEVTGNPYAEKAAAQLAVTHDEYQIAGPAGTTGQVHRTILHLIWWEESSGGNKILYTPITLIEGVFSGYLPVFTINDFDSGRDDFTAAAALTPQLSQAPRIEKGRNDHTVVLSFANERNGRLSVVEISVLAGEIRSISGGVRAHIIEIGRGKSIAAIAAGARAHIIEIGRLHSRVLSMLADDIYSHILERGPSFDGNLEALADDASDYLTRVAATLIENARSEDEEEPQILSLGSLSGALPATAPLIQIRQVFGRPAPPTGAAPITLFASEDGRKVLVAWELSQKISYRESQAEGWSPVVTLQLGPDLTREKAEELLTHRVRR